jgi:hypothetical protein
VELASFHKDNATDTVFTATESTIEPTSKGANKINEHDLYITRAETYLDEQSIIELSQFKNLTRYNEQRTQMTTRLTNEEKSKTPEETTTERNDDSNQAMPHSSAMLISKTERKYDSKPKCEQFTHKAQVAYKRETVMAWIELNELERM